MADTPVPFEVLVRWIESNEEYRVPVKHIFPTSVEEVLEIKAHVALLNIVLGNTRLNDIQHQYLAQTFILFNILDFHSLGQEMAEGPCPHHVEDAAGGARKRRTFQLLVSSQVHVAVL